MTYKTVERPGYFGKKRDEIIASLNEKYGHFNWKIAWELGDLVLDKSEALQVYEDAYFIFFKTNSYITEWLLDVASDIYDTAPSNVEAGLSYTIQETPNNHIHDVAIRRSLMRLGKKFRGTEVIQVRGEGTPGEKVSPHMIPFHLPTLISKEPIQDYNSKGMWWRTLGAGSSVEEFYQQNKVVQVLSKE